MAVLVQSAQSVLSARHVFCRLCSCLLGWRLAVVSRTSNLVCFLKMEDPTTVTDRFLSAHIT